MRDTNILKIGIIGSVVAAICCFAPILVIGFGLAGVSAWLGWIDYVLIPAFALSLGIIVYGLWRRKRTRSRRTGRAKAAE